MDIKWVDGKTLTESDLQELARIDFLIPGKFDASWSPTDAEIKGRAEMFAKLGAQDFFQVIRDGARIVGFHVINGRKDGIAHISTLWVHSELRGLGWGRRLKEAGHAWAKDNGFTHLQTGVHAGNKRMHEINIKNGFEPFSTIYRLKL